MKRPAFINDCLYFMHQAFLTRNPDRLAHTSPRSRLDEHDFTDDITSCVCEREYVYSFMNTDSVDYSVVCHFKRKEQQKRSQSYQTCHISSHYKGKKKILEENKI